MKEQGKGIKTIKRELGLAKETVRRFYRAASVEELLAKPRAGRRSILDEYKPYLHERWSAGCTNASRLDDEIAEQGYRGSRATVAAYVAPFRPLGIAPPATPSPPKVREITSWMLSHPDRLDADEQVKLKEVLAACPHLDATATHVSAFAEMLTGLQGPQLDGWMQKVQHDDLPYLHSFVNGHKRDHDAVLNGLTLTHNSGAVEGNVNRIQNDQTTDIRPSHLRPATQANPARRMTTQGSVPSRSLGQNPYSSADERVRFSILTYPQCCHDPQIARLT